LGRADAHLPDRLSPPPQARFLIEASRADEARTIAGIAALIGERRRLRARPKAGTMISVDNRARLAAIDTELDQLWTGLRRGRTPVRHVPPSSTEAPS
jgi:hypothetical protein